MGSVGIVEGRATRHIPSHGVADSSSGPSLINIKPGCFLGDHPPKLTRVIDAHFLSLLSLISSLYFLSLTGKDM